MRLHVICLDHLKCSKYQFGLRWVRIPHRAVCFYYFRGRKWGQLICQGGTNQQLQIKSRFVSSAARQQLLMLLHEQHGSRESDTKRTCDTPCSYHSGQACSSALDQAVISLPALISAVEQGIAKVSAISHRTIATKHYVQLCLNCMRWPGHYSGQ